MQGRHGTLSTSLAFEEEAPYRVAITIDESGKKGVESTEYRFNLAFLDQRGIKWESNKKEMNVTLEADEKMIQVTKNGERDNYEDALAIPCLDIDNARLIEGLLRKALPIAKELWREDSGLPTEFSALENYLSAAVKEVREGEEVYIQDLKPLDGPAPRFAFSKRHLKNGETKLEGSYVFNFADIHPPAVDISVKGKSIFVELQAANRNKYIEVTEDGKLDFTNELQVHTASYEDAQLLATTLRQYLPKAGEYYRESFPSFQTEGEAFLFLKETVRSYRFNEANVIQSVSGGCLFDLERQVTDDKEAKTERFLMALSDLDPGSVEIDVSSKGIWVSAETKGRNKYVMPFENGEQQNYDDDLLIGAADIPNAKNIRYGLAESIRLCKGEVEAEGFGWLSALVNESEVAGIRQQLQAIDGNTCKLALTIVEEGKRDDEEMRYEFNLYDLDEHSVSLDTRGTAAFLEMATNYKERVINLYTEDGDLEYEKELILYVPDIPSGKIALATMKRLIEGCEE